MSDVEPEDVEPGDVTDEPGVQLPEGVTVAESGRFQCPDCERDYKNVDDLQSHRRLRHGLAKKARGRPRKTHSGSGSDGSPRRGEQGPGLRRVRREKEVRETLEEIVAFSRAARGEAIDVQSLIDVLDRDKAKLAVGIAYLAEKFNPLGSLIDLTMGRGGVLTIVQGFSGVGRWVLGRWRVLLSEREGPEEIVPFFAGDVEEAQQPVEGDGNAYPFG